MEKEKVFISNQLACMLPPLALKVLNYLVNWQSQVQIKYYDKQFAKMMHLDKSEVEIAIQTLLDLKLITCSMIDQKWIIELENSQIQRYFKVPMSKVAEHEGFKMSEEITWNKVDTPKTEDMSTEQLQKMILMLQAQLNEKKETEKLIKAASEPQDDLPW